MQLGVMELVGILNLIGTLVLGVFVSRIRKLEDDLKKAMSEAVDIKLDSIKETLSRHDDALGKGETHFRLLREADANLRVEVIKEIAALSAKVVTQHDLVKALKEARNG